MHNFTRTHTHTRARAHTRAHTHTHARTRAHARTHTVGLLRTSDQLVTCHYLHNKHKRQTFMPLAGFEPKIPTIKRPQTYALDRTATGIGYPEKLLEWIVQRLVDKNSCHFF